VLPAFWLPFDPGLLHRSSRWVFAYIFKAAFGEILSTNPEVTSAAFGSLISNPVQSLLWQWGVLVVIRPSSLPAFPRASRTPPSADAVLFLILVMLCIRSLTLPGAAQGLASLHPDFSKVTGATALTAMGLSFFKLSVGMGTMITYGSISVMIRTSPQPRPK
jgi:NSS family neurotransmitter:Na+ symporter